MKLNLSYSDLSEIYQVSLPSSDLTINSVGFDTRKINDGTHTMFFCLKGKFRDGHDFIEQAFAKGVRTFIVDHLPELKLQGTQFIVVEDTLKALQLLAKNHRSKFNYPVVAITGSSGKTIVKEWLAHILSGKYKVVRSPKSYNSQLGVALSLLEMNHDATIAIIEAGISQVDEMAHLKEMIQPTLGIFTNIGSAHAANFPAKDVHLAEKMTLFSEVNHLIAHESIGLKKEGSITIVSNTSYFEVTKAIFQDEVSITNASLACAMALHLEMNLEEIANRLKTIQPIALRLETFDGIKGSLIINDTYSLDIDAFRSSLEYQMSISDNRKRVVIVDQNADRQNINALIEEYQPIEVHYVNAEDSVIESITNSVVLIKGMRSSAMEKHATQYRLKKHQTHVEIDLNAVKSNIEFIKSKLPENTKILTMVKASSYGSGGEKMGKFLERIGVDYMGVAYADEGVDLRNVGVKTPILVMNPEEAGFADCINNDLEPAIYSLSHLESFIKECLYLGKTHYPIHIKLETGMNRLGFSANEIPSLVEKLKAQPEVIVSSIYSHLASADQLNSSFVEEQVATFEELSSLLMSQLSYEIDRHILNSEGSLNYSNHHYEMVRIGIGMYGSTSNEEMASYLKPVIKWHSSISQIKHVPSGHSVGYGRSEVVDTDTVIAIIPVGYADGFRRSLSKGKGGVYHNYHFLPVIGNVCMDMIMVDVTGLEINEHDPIEIIGDHQSLKDLAKAMDTIPYEVLTGISKRVHRIYLED